MVTGWEPKKFRHQLLRLLALLLHIRRTRESKIDRLPAASGNFLRVVAGDSPCDHTNRYGSWLSGCLGGLNALAWRAVLGTQAVNGGVWPRR